MADSYTFHGLPELLLLGWRFFAGPAIMRALYGRTKPPIGNPDKRANCAEMAESTEAQSMAMTDIIIER